MLLSKEVQVKIDKRHYDHYNVLGYEIPIRKIGKGFTVPKGTVITVKIEDLLSNSSSKVLVRCDYCGEEFYKEYYDYNKSMRLVNMCCCSNIICMNKKRVDSNISKYGSENVMYLDEYKEKLKTNMIEKYGVENPMYLDENKEKIKSTCLEKYGSEYSFQSEEVKDKIRETMLARYGVEYGIHSDEIRSKIEETNIIRYGFKNTFSNKEIINKSKQTVLEKYGVENISQCEEIKIKKAESFYRNGTIATSNQQRYLNNLFGGVLNYSNNSPSLDIAFPEEKIYIEYNGSGHDLCVKRGNMTRQQFENKERARYYYMKRLGWKGVFINSNCDYLPSDDVLLKEIDKARQWFKIDDVGHSHYNIDIGNKVDDEKYGKVKKLKKVSTI